MNQTSSNLLPKDVYTMKTVVDMDVKGLMKDKLVNNEQVYWSKRQRKIWICSLFLGSVMSYITRVAGPVTVVAMGQDLVWDKTVAVSKPKMPRRIFGVRFII